MIGRATGEGAQLLAHALPTIPLDVAHGPDWPTTPKPEKRSEASHERRSVISPPMLKPMAYAKLSAKANSSSTALVAPRM